MSEIFISYRRDDSSYASGWIYEQLAKRYGKKHVFMDVDKMSGGIDFRSKIEQTIRQSDIMLVVIGPRWTAIDDNLQSRLHNPDDVVRVEIEVAIEHGVAIIPLLLNGATMPKGNQLPPTLKSLSTKHALSLRSLPDFYGDVDKIRKAIKDRSMSSIDLQAPAHIRAMFKWQSKSAYLAFSSFVAASLIGMLGALLTANLTMDFSPFGAHPIFLYVQNTNYAGSSAYTKYMIDSGENFHIFMIILLLIVLIAMGISAAYLIYFVRKNTQYPQIALKGSLTMLVFIGTPLICILCYGFAASSPRLDYFIYATIDDPNVYISKTLSPIVMVFNAAILICLLILVFVISLKTSYPRITIGSGFALLIYTFSYIQVAEPLNSISTILTIIGTIILIIATLEALIRCVQVNQMRWFIILIITALSSVLLSFSDDFAVQLFGKLYAEPIILILSSLVSIGYICWPLAVFTFGVIGPVKVQSEHHPAHEIA